MITRDEAYELLKKYNKDESELIAYIDECREKLDAIVGADDRLLRLEKELAAQEQKVRTAAAALRKKREDAGKILQARIQSELSALRMPSVRFETEILDCPDYQGNAVVNYTSHDKPYTRIIEHKHFEMFGQQVYDTPKTVVSEEYSTEYKPGMEPYYPVNDERNNAIADAYRRMAAEEKDVIFGGRLAEYKYYDMAPVIEKAMEVEF